MTPQLRFPEFTDTWQMKRLGDISEKGQYGMNAASKHYDGTNKYLRITDVDEDSHKFNHDSLTSPGGQLEDRYLLECGDLLFVRTGASTGKTYLYNNADGKVFFAGFLIRFHVDEADPYFVYSQTLRRNYQKWVTTMSARSGQPGINADEFSKLSISLPTRPEQEKIADFLTVVDERIAASERKCELLTHYKRGVMQQLFSQKIHFNKTDRTNYPDWQEKKLGEVFNEVASKVGTRGVETYSITAGKGFISQTKKFGRDISGTQNERYTLLSENEFAYNKGNSKTYTFGCVYENREGKQIAVPNVFISFKLNDNRMASGFFAQLFINHYLDSHLRKIISSGARMDGLLNVNKADFFSISIPVPTAEEQQEIADFLTTLDSRITTERTKLTAAKRFKKALLQGMFV